MDKLIKIVISAAIVAGLAYLTYWNFYEREKTGLDPADNKTREGAISSTIEGSLTCANELCWNGMKICAEKVEDKKDIFCTEDFKKDEARYGTSGRGYKLTVPSGKYNIFAQNSSLGGAKSYYCSTCSGGEPISVDVMAFSNVQAVSWEFVGLQQKD